MADEASFSVTSSATETSPAAVESPADAGLGATDAKQVQSTKAEDGYRKLQSQLDRERRRREEAELEASRAYRMIGDSRTRESFQAAKARLPDPLSDPEGHSRALEALAMQYIDKARSEASEANQRQATVDKTWKMIDSYIADLNAEFGVELTRDDEEIIIRNGPNAERIFKTTARARAKEAALLKKIAALESANGEQLREAGIDRFDGGGGSSGGAEGPMSFERWSNMTWAQRQAYRKDKPDQIRQMERRMASGRSA